MPKRIAYLTSSYARAGDTFIRQEVEELRALGWTVLTYSIRRAAGEDVSDEIRREQRSTDYILEHGPWRLLGTFVRMWLRAPSRMIRALALGAAIRSPGLRSWLRHWAYLLEASYLAERLLAERIALLHDHISMNSATVAMLASAISGVPFSMTVHGPHDFLEAERWALGAKVAASVLTVCISDFGRSQCMLFSPPDSWGKLQVVRCGVDARFLDEAPRPFPRGPRLVSVGRLSPEKGQVLLVRAAAALRAQGIAAEIVLIGDGPSRAEIERTARELSVTDAIQLVGWQGSGDVLRLVSESRALVLPSFAEGIPVVLMEAMALRRPVIATFVGGIPELVKPGENGWLVPAGSIDELADAMREVLSAPAETLERMGERGRQRVMEHHDLHAAGRALSDLFERALATEDEARRPAAARGRALDP